MSMYDNDNFCDWYEQQDKDTLFKEYLDYIRPRLLANPTRALDLTYDDFQSVCFEKFRVEGQECHE